MTKIGDIITELPVPDDVIEMTGDDGDPWRRGDDGSWTCRDRRGQVYGGLSCQAAARMLEYAPLRVVEVAASGPLVLTLPEEPKGATALVGVESGRRWEPTPVNGGRWQDVVSGQIRPWIGVLEREGSVTVEFATPPREPRTWPKLDGHEFDSLPDAVTVDDDDHRGVWRRCSPEGVLYSDGMSGMTLAELRTLGTVTEVFGDA